MAEGDKEEKEEDKGSPYDKMMDMMKAMMKGMGGQILYLFIYLSSRSITCF